MEFAMSDFLTRLVATTYGAAPVMQPRPVAQFEPLTPPLTVGLQAIDATPLTPPEMTAQATSATQLAGALAATTASATTASVTTASAVIARPTALVNPTVQPAQSTPPGHAASPSAAMMSQSGLALQDRRAAQTLDAARGQVRLPDVADASMRPPREQGSAADPLQASPQHAVIWQSAASPVAPLPYVHALQRAPEALQARAASSSAPPHAEQGATVAPPASSAGQTAPATPVSPRAAFAARVAARVAADHPAQRSRGGAPAPLQPPPVIPADSETAPAPIIRVTIGRIVIKAEPARTTLSTAARQPVAPKLSLDQYLQGRNGGDR